MATESIDEDLRLLEFKLAQLKRDYDQYFLGTRPREPVQLRGEVNKAVIELTNTAIKHTAARFKFSSICSRYQAFRRQWDDILRKIEAGTYERHRFKANLHARDRGLAPEGAPAPAAGAPGGGADLFEQYRDARLACGQSVESLSPRKLEASIAKQRAALAERFGPEARFRFRVVIEDGQAKVKASREKA